MLLGGDMVTACTVLPAVSTLAVVSADATSRVFEAAARLGAAYVVVLPAGADWLSGLLARLAGDPVARLRSAGFRVGFADCVACPVMGRRTVHAVAGESFSDGVRSVAGEECLRAVRRSASTASAVARTPDESWW
jgi:hypothetical protein